jgi:hypothetical protein
MASDVRNTNAWKIFQYSHSSVSQPRLSAALLMASQAMAVPMKMFWNTAFSLPLAPAGMTVPCLRGDGADHGDEQLAAEDDEQDPERQRADGDELAVRVGGRCERM